MVRLVFSVVIFYVAVLGGPRIDAMSARETRDAQADTVWTVLIPDAFPHDIYTWHLNADGGYLEDGRDAATGKPIQSTLHGRWSSDGVQMILRQDGLPYAFDGVVLGSRYAGTMYFNGRSRSRFCAVKGEQPPERCNPPPDIAMIPRQSALRNLCKGKLGCAKLTPAVRFLLL